MKTSETKSAINRDKLVQDLVELQLLEDELSRRDSSYFTSCIMKDPLTGKYFKQARIHKKWHNALKVYLWLLIESAREHGKSEQVKSWAIKKIGDNPNIRMKYISNNLDQAIKRVSSIGQEIEKNEDVNRIYPNLKPDYKTGWTKGKLFVERTLRSTDATIESYGILSSGTGSRADVLIFDDVVDFENTIKNPAWIPMVKSAYREKWLNLLTPNGMVLYIFTRWHERDLSHELIKESTQGIPAAEQYHYVVDLINDNLDSICDLWPQERLEARLGSIGKRAFARNFQGRAMSDDEALFQDIDNCLDYEYSLEQIPEAWHRYIFTGVDVGHRGGEMAAKGHAYSVIFTGIVTPDGKRIPIDIQRGKWTSKQTAERLINVQQRFKPLKILVENNGYQDALREWTNDLAKQKGVGINIQGYFTGAQKLDEAIGLPSLALEFENKKWQIPMGEQEHKPGCQCWLCNWINEMKSYPVAEFKDQVMACWLFKMCIGNTCVKANIQADNPRSTMKELDDYVV